MDYLRTVRTWVDRRRIRRRMPLLGLPGGIAGSCDLCGIDRKDRCNAPYGLRAGSPTAACDATDRSNAEILKAEPFSPGEFEQW